jgi:hypothetical protein
MKKPLIPCKGLDLRPGMANAPGFCTHLKNIVVTTNGRPVRRPALDYRLALPAGSVGLHAVGDDLRILAPSGTDDSNLAPTVTIDYITDPGQSIAAVLGAIADFSGRTMALVQLADDSTALHHCPPTGTEPGTSTLLSPGFTPQFSLIKAAGRAWTLDGNLRSLRGSRLEGTDPATLEDWTSASTDDGPLSLDVANYSAGRGRPMCLGTFAGRVAVFYRGAVLLYRMDENQNRIGLEQAVAGPGTRAERSPVEINGDLVFLSDSGIRLVSQVTQTLDARADAMGGKVDDYALNLAANLSLEPIGHYCSRLGCYLLAFGQDVLCLSMVPGESVRGWSTWRLPVPVHAFAEAQGLTWIRSGNMLFSLNPSIDVDDTGPSTTAAIPVLYESVPDRSEYDQVALRVSVTSTESVAVQVVADDRPALAVDETLLGRPTIVPGRAPEPVSFPVTKVGKSIAIRVFDAEAGADWRLDDLALEVTR